ncbi:hemerythrin domain-containing protein [Devosia sp. ZB163]|uniref:hemerythrin domain-containing protein n=1 Tax=Devosia sp. ZB163 TaxID=3025938 RepID=UPI0023610124|nr:hemerythrin domain-containing protein [Devosia sp. ZB163]MDC9823791.1 hemerythrin domain-containing protein [Devosia sp. ZB163]
MIASKGALEEVREFFEQQLALCDLLEAIADSLPNRLNHARCLTASKLIGPLLREAHAAEEAVLFPSIVATHARGTQMVEQLRLEHLEDECFGEEVQFELHQLACKQPVLAPEATGYMLRGFFECLRRHVRHERQLLNALPAQAALN